MHEGSLKLRIILLACLPVLLLTLLLAGFFLKAYFKTVDQQLIAYSKNLSLEIRQQITTSLDNNETDKIIQISKHGLNKPDVRAIAVFNAEGKLVSHVGPDMITVSPLAFKDTSLLPSAGNQITWTEKSLRISDPLVYQRSQNSAQIRGKVGRIEIEIATLGNTLKKYQAAGLVALVLALSWAIQGLIAYFLSARAQAVTTELSRAMTAIQEGNLDTQVDFKIDLMKFGPLKSLQQTFNVMITTLRQSQSELKETLEQATEDVRETLETIEIQNIELDMARKEALKASRIKSEFLANMSHEIRTPLNSIIGFTKLLLKTPLTPRQKDQLETIRKSSNGLLSIINEILDFSKIEAGKLILEQAPLDMREAVDDVIDLLSPQANEKNLEQVVIFYSDVPNHLIGDPQRIKQVLTNLINNAIKFSDQGTIIIRIILESENDSSVVIRCSVSDKGIGLSEEQQKDLFTAFSQANTQQFRSHGGTGLGLVISKHLVEKMGGEIGFESEVNEGSTFWFTCRLKIDHAKEGKVEKLAFNTIKVALFDDNKATSLSVSHLLENENFLHSTYETLAALYQGVKQAYQEQAGYDYAAIGINQTYENNQQLIALIEEIETIYNCKVIVLANLNEDSSYQRLIEQTSSFYFSKPVTYRKFITCILELCGESVSQATIAQTGVKATNESLPCCKILAVDDNASNLKLISSFLTDLGADVTAVNSGEKAIESATKTSFDLILMDVRMPGIGGIEATKKIRHAEPNGKHVPIIAVTAHAMANEKITLLSSGMNDYITKPIDEAQLKYIINKWTTGFNINPESPIPKSTLAQADFAFTEPKPMETMVIDFDESIRLAGGKIDLAKDIYLELINNLAADKAVIQQAKNNREELLDRVHKLHGGTRYCGVPELRAATAQLETRIKEGRQPEIELAFDDLIVAINQLLAWHQENQEYFLATFSSNDDPNSIRH